MSKQAVQDDYNHDLIVFTPDESPVEKVTIISDGKGGTTLSKTCDQSHLSTGNDHLNNNRLIMPKTTGSLLVNLSEQSLTMLNYNAQSSVALAQSKSDAQNGNCSKTQLLIAKPIVVNDSQVAQELKLRSYQNELAESALKGNNCVICAPTGSGKTIIAVKIIQQHLDDRNGNGKVAFLVPTVHLVNQQKELVNKYLGNRYIIRGISGGQSCSKSIPKAQVVMDSHITIMTPALILNMFTDPDQNIKINEFTLIIFDECHHTDKSHSYACVMVNYFEQKFGNSLPNSAQPLPQIVGLTASLGVGNADSSLSAREHILDTCARLDAKRLCTVTENLNDLTEFVNVPNDELVRVPADHIKSSFLLFISNAMGMIEKKVMPLIDQVLEQLPKNNPDSSRLSQMLCEPPQDRWNQRYTTWVCQLQQHIPVIHSSFKCDLLSYLDHLYVYHNSLILNAHVPATQAYEYLKNEFETFTRKLSSPIDKTLVEIYQQHEKLLLSQLKSDVGDKENSLVRKLKEILIQEYTDRKDSRTIVFAVTRQLCYYLEKHFNQSDMTAAIKSLNSSRLISTNTSTQSFGQSPGEQQQALANFRSGKCKVLFATSVAEEGLDVAECQLIIKYNYVTNETALVQRRGRARAANSRSVLLTHDGKTEEKEILNMQREKMMNDAIALIRAQGTVYFQKEMTGRQNDRASKEADGRANEKFEKKRTGR